MSRGKRGMKVVCGSALLVGLLGMSASGCSAADDLAGGGCGAELQGKVEALQASVDGMVSLAGSMKADVALACKSIAEAGGETVTIADEANPTDDEVTAACNSASASIEASFMAAGSCSFSASPAECRVNAEAQVSCEGGCKVDASCEEPSIDVRCMGGEVSFECSGECMGTATCEGSASVKAECEGTCQATCEGTCGGTCNGECDGQCSSMNGDGSCAGTCEGTCNGNCEGSCMGTCTGKCELAADASVTCSAEARCEGECSGMATAPTCSGEIAPPMCEADAECQASCEGNAKFEAECTPPSVELLCSGSIDADFIASFEANLPVLLSVVAKGELVVDAAGKIVTDFTALVQGSATCAASLAGELKAAAEASVSVNVSVMASASAG